MPASPRSTNARLSQGRVASRTELIDNATILLVPGAIEAGMDEVRFWAPLLGGFLVAWPFTFVVNRAMIRRGKGHVVAHDLPAH